MRTEEGTLDARFDAGVVLGWLERWACQAGSIFLAPEP